jgi:hypothetical protein
MDSLFSSFLTLVFQALKLLSYMKISLYAVPKRPNNQLAEDLGVIGNKTTVATRFKMRNKTEDKGKKKQF